jgi:putative flippase GtrA
MWGSRLLREARGYVVASASAFALDFALLALQVSLLRVPYLPAASISFVAGTMFVYWASIRYVFRFRGIDDRRMELAIFVTIGLVGLVVNLAVMYVAVTVIGLHYLLGKCLAAMVTVGLNFALRRWMLFLPRSHAATARELPR